HADFGSHFVRQVEAAHIDNQVESRARQVADGFGKMVAQVETLLGHRAHSVARYRHRRRQAGAGGNDHVAAISARKGFGHLAAARIPDAHKEDPPGLPLHSFGSPLSFSRKSRWTRESAVSSG